MKVRLADQIITQHRAAQKPRHRRVQARTRDEEVLVRAALLCHIGGIGQDGKPRAHAAKLCRIVCELARDRALSRPAVDELQSLGRVTREDVRHGVLVDAPAANDGNRVVRDVRAKAPLDIALEQNADGRARAGERDERGGLALLLVNLLGETRRRTGCDLGVARERIEIRLQVLFRRLVFQGQHLRVMPARLNELFPLCRRQRVELSRDVFQKDRHVVLLVCTEHRPLLPRHSSQLIR